VRASLSRHFHSLLEAEDALRPVALDEALVARARSTIQQASIPQLMYSQVKLTYAGDTGRAVRLDVAAGIGADRVLKRKSGVSLSEAVPSLYTRKVFEEITGRGTAELVKDFAKDSWVWGEQGLSVVGSARLSAEMMDVYEKDYIAAWDRILNDLDVVPFSGPRTTEALAILAGSTSPLRGFLKAVDDNTFLIKPDDPAKPPSGVRKRIDDIFARGKEAIGMSNVAPGTQITEHFEPIHRLVAGEPGSAPIDGVLGKIGQIQQQLAPIGASIGQKPPDAATSASVGQLVQALGRDAAALPPSVGTVVARVGRLVSAVTSRGIRDELDSRYRQEVLRQCLDAIDGRYPFSPGSTVDVALTDFGRVFGYNGVFHSFFEETLRPYVDTTRNPWVWRTDASGASAGGSEVMLRQFRVAERIRETFFRSGSQTPELAFTVTPYELDAAATRFVLELDGQSFEYRHGPERASRASWPGPNPGGAAATFETRSGGRPPNLTFDGPWAWFKLVDAGQLHSETDLRHVVSFAAGGHNARVRVEATSIHNPWASREWQQFRCGI
jgi:type VI secretion system protein ImpL